MKRKDKLMKENKKYMKIMKWEVNSFPTIKIKFWEDNEEDL